MTAKQGPRAGAGAEDSSAGPLFAAAEAGGTGSDAAGVRDEGAEGGKAQGGGVPPAGDAEDTAAAGEAPDDPRRLNRNMEQMLETMDGLVDVLLETQKRLDAAGSGDGKKADGTAADGATVEAADFHRWIETDRRRRRRWSLAAVAAAAPAALLLGLLVQQQFEVIPLHDPTGGWRGHVWERYGRTVVDCAAEAMRTGAEVDCPLVVRRP